MLERREVERPLGPLRPDLGVQATKEPAEPGTPTNPELTIPADIHYHASLPSIVRRRVFLAVIQTISDRNRHYGMTPRATKRDQTIPLGIVGGGPAWEARYRAAVLALTRGRVAAVFSPQPCDGEVLAQETGGQLFHSLRRLISHPGVKALLILESGWSREWAIELATAKQMPVLVASPVDEALPHVVSSLAEQEAEGAVIVPGALLRATPATLRLRELVATKLGRIQYLDVELTMTSTSVDSQVVEVIDWCRSLLNSTVTDLHREDRPEGDTLVMSCGGRSSSTPPLHIEIRLAGAELRGTVPTGLDAAFPHVHIQCQHGEAELLSETHIRWKTPTETGHETLENDRPAEQVLLDLFLRRVVGGVVPVPCWAELAEACRLWQSVNGCRTGDPR